MSGAPPPHDDGRVPAVPEPERHVVPAGRAPYGVDELLSAIGHQVRILRQAARMHQETLAARAGVSRSHIVRLEHHPTTIGLRHLHQVADALGVSVSQLIAAAEDQARIAAHRPGNTGPKEPRSPTVHN